MRKCVRYLDIYTDHSKDEGADKIAKIATKINNIIDMPYGKTEVKAILKKEVIKKWQERWDREEIILCAWC